MLLKLPNIIKYSLLGGLLLSLVGCITPPPRDQHNICSIFKQYPAWARETKDVQKRWLVPVAVQMAIIHQESSFNAQAQPARRKLLWFIPWDRPSTAYGYAQALRSTWRYYQRDSGYFLASRTSFSDGVDFIGWYANQAYKRANIARTDPYSLYLAYHEGIGGYMHKTYLRKPWLVRVAHKVSARASLYQAQLNRCS